MKIGCKVDGVHFVNDFDLTFIPPCNFWGDLGFSNLPIELKKKFWDWVFTMPTDEIAIASKLGVGISFTVTPIDDATLFENTVKGWHNLTEGEKQLVEKNHFKLYAKNPTLAMQRLQKMDFTNVQKKGIIKKIKEKFKN